MNTIADPAMQEIINEFCVESSSLLLQLECSLEEFESDLSDTKKLETFGQIIDRIMGSSKTLGIQEVATFCELGKTIGYKSAQVSDKTLLTVVVAILFDAVDILRKMIQEIKTGNSTCLENLNTEAFKGRLRWLSAKFKDIERASCQVGSDASKVLEQSSIDDLMASLGL